MAYGFGNYYSEDVRVVSGRSSGRSTFDQLQEGTVRIVGQDPKGHQFERTVQFRGGDIFDNRLKLDGKTVHHIVYGQFETTIRNGKREITHFNPKTGKGLHGLSRRYGSLFKHEGVCTTWYNRGRLVRQVFRYDNGRTAYDYRGYSRPFTVRDYDGEILYEITGAIGGQNNCFYGGPSILERPMKEWFLQSAPFQVKKRPTTLMDVLARPVFRQPVGLKIVYAGQYSNRQKVGEWVEDGKKVYYENGMAIPVKLYRTPPEKLDPVKILKLPNAQLRMALCAKIGPERIAKCGKVVHKDGDMRLIDIKGYDVKILRVRCPSTKAYYFLRVPKDSAQCEEARQWTFGVGEGPLREPIQFAVET